MCVGVEYTNINIGDMPATTLTQVYLGKRNFSKNSIDKQYVGPITDLQYWVLNERNFFLNNASLATLIIGSILVVIGTLRVNERSDMPKESVQGGKLANAPHFESGLLTTIKG